MTRTRARWVAVGLFVSAIGLTGAMVGCTTDDIPAHVQGAAPAAPAGSATPTTPMPGDEGGSEAGLVSADGSIVDAADAALADVVKIIDPSGPAYQTKSADQLKNALTQCLGAGVTTVTAGMIQSSTVTDGGSTGAGGRFLSPAFTSGDDIVDVQRPSFDGPDPLARGDQMTLTYLTALRNVANVAAARCELGLATTPSLCACGGPDSSKATLMIQRCLPSVDPTTPLFAQVRDAFYQACMQSSGKAIASMIASSTYARFR